MRRVWTLLRWLLALYLAVLVLLFAGQRRLLYPRGPAAPLWGEVERLPDGVAVVRSGPDPRVVWFHGNGGQVGHERWVAERLGRPVLLPEYPGYGDSPGQPTEGSILAAARTALGSRTDWACLGQSLGTGVAMAMAAEGRCARLVLVSPYTTIPEAAEHSWPFVFARWLVLDQWDSRTRAAQVRVPTLIVHGTDDRVVPLAMGRELSGRIRGAALTEVVGRGHNDVLTRAAWREIVAFLDAAQEPV